MVIVQALFCPAVAHGVKGARSRGRPFPAQPIASLPYSLPIISRHPQSSADLTLPFHPSTYLLSRPFLSEHCKMPSPPSLCLCLPLLFLFMFVLPPGPSGSPHCLTHSSDKYFLQACSVSTNKVRFPPSSCYLSEPAVSGLPWVLPAQ